MPTQVKPKMANFTKNAKQPSGTKVVHEQKAFGQKVGKNPAPAPSHGKLKEGNLTANASQPAGSSIGAGTDVAEHMAEHTRPVVTRTSRALTGTTDGFRLPTAKADCFRGTTKNGVLRMSGHPGAHRIGGKK